MLESRNGLKLEHIGTKEWWTLKCPILISRLDVSNLWRWPIVIKGLLFSVQIIHIISFNVQRIYIFCMQGWPSPPKPICSQAREVLNWLNGHASTIDWRMSMGVPGRLEDFLYREAMAQWNASTNWFHPFCCLVLRFAPLWLHASCADWTTPYPSTVQRLLILETFTLGRVSSVRSPQTLFK